jgi:Ricin-type beta-trefoil lectin domain-like
MNTSPTPQNRPDQPEAAARRHRHRGAFRRAALAATVLAGAGTLMLAVSGSAFAAGLDQTSPQWEELGPWGYTPDQASQVTAVYTIQNVAEAEGKGTQMLEDHGNSLASGGTVDVWTQVAQTTNQDPMATGPYGLITQANYLWEFVPANPGNGPSILDGPGELINRQSGLCLDIDNNSQDNNAAIDQWTCNGGANQQWAAEPDNNGSYEVVSVLDGYGKALGIGTENACILAGNGDSVSVYRTDNGNPCERWDIQQASYDFASHPIGVPDEDSEIDGRGYECIAGDTLRADAGSYGAGAGNYVYRFDQWDFRNIGDPSVTVDETVPALSSYPNYVPNGILGYSQVGSASVLTGQVMYYCDPPTQSL